MSLISYFLKTIKFLKIGLENLEKLTLLLILDFPKQQYFNKTNKNDLCIS